MKRKFFWEIWILFGFLLLWQPSRVHALEYGTDDFLVSVHGILEMNLEMNHQRPSTFDNHHAFLLINGDIHKNVQFNFETEYRHSGSEIFLNLVELNWKIYDDIFVIRGGRMLAPIGMYSYRLRYPSRSRLSLIPSINVEILPENLYVNGFGIKGVIGKKLQFHYSFAIFNGFEDVIGSQVHSTLPTHEPVEVDGETLPAKKHNGLDNNEDKSISGRIAFRYGKLLEIGAAFLTTVYTDKGCTIEGCENFRSTYYAGDLRVRYKGFELQSEFILNGFDVKKGTRYRYGGYAEFSYQFMFQTKYPLHSLQPVLRLEWIEPNRERDDLNDRFKIYGGIKYYPYKNFHIKVEYAHNIELLVDAVDDYHFGISMVGAY